MFIKREELALKKTFGIVSSFKKYIFFYSSQYVCCLCMYKMVFEIFVDLDRPGDVGKLFS